MIKLIAMDLDWTLVDHTPGAIKIGKEIISALNSFVEHGNHAGIVSGRPLWGFQDTFMQSGVAWGEHFPSFVVSREAYIYEVKNGEFEDLQAYNRSMRGEIMCFNRKFTLYIDDALKMYEENKIPVYDFIVYGDFATEIAVSYEQADEAVALMKKFIKRKGLLDAAVHRNCNSVTVYSKCAGKGKTLLAAARHFGLEPAEVLAIGDNYNDESMIDGKLGFIGGCVGNADEKLKDIVRAGGGFVGTGTAYNGILDIMRQAQEAGLL